MTIPEAARHRLGTMRRLYQGAPEASRKFFGAVLIGAELIAEALPAEPAPPAEAQTPATTPPPGPPTAPAVEATPGSPPPEAETAHAAATAEGGIGQSQPADASPTAGTQRVEAPPYEPPLKAEAREAFESGKSARDIAADFGLPMATVSTWVAEWRLLQRTAGAT